MCTLYVSLRHFVKAYLLLRGLVLCGSAAIVCGIVVCGGQVVYVMGMENYL